MERTEWLKKMRSQTEALYDHLAPAYWVTFGLYPNKTHRLFIDKMLKRLEPTSVLLDAGCGAGRYDGMLIEAGHTVLGIDQAGSMLARARENFPEADFPGLHYRQMGLQEMAFEAAFDGAICVDALEHISPEDWPGIVGRFQNALRPGGVLYVTVDAADWEDVQKAYDRAKALGLPVVHGEVADEIDTAYDQAKLLDWEVLSGTQTDHAVYHFHPDLKQVRAWFNEAGLVIEEEKTGDGYHHILARKHT